MKHVEKIILPNGKTRTRVYTTYEQPSKTDESFKDDCDVNIILDRFMKTGQITHLAKKPSSYADVSDIPNLLDAHIAISNAKTAFGRLPSELRRKLNNDPLNLEEYLKDPENHEEAEHYGLLQIKQKFQKKSDQKTEGKKASATPNDKTNDSTEPSKPPKKSE